MNKYCLVKSKSFAFLSLYIAFWSIQRERERGEREREKRERERRERERREDERER